MRKDLNKESKLLVLQTLEKEDDLIRQAERAKMTKIMCRTMMIEYRIVTMVQRFRARYQKKKAMMAERENTRLRRQTFSLNDERKLELEEEVLTLSGTLLFASSDKKSHQGSFERIKTKLPKLSFSKFHFYFLEGVLIWKKKKEAPKPEGKVYMFSVEEIQVEGELHLMFVNLR